MPPFLHEQERRSPAGASPGQRHKKEELLTQYQKVPRPDSRINWSLTPITTSSPATSATGFVPFEARGVVVSNELIDRLRDNDGV